MTSYFSQLAQHTGLAFGASATARARTSTEAEPLHREELVFTNNASPVEAAAVDAPAIVPSLVARAETGTSARDQLLSSAITERPFVVADPAPRSRAGSRALDAAPVAPRTPNVEPRAQRPITADARAVQATPEPRVDLDVPLEPEPLASRPELEMTNVPATPAAHLSAARAIATTSLDPAPARSPLATENELDDELAREVVLHSYLKEVRAWLSAPPELDALASEREPPALETPARGAELESARSSERSRETPTMNVQDLKLSIGTIRVVVEESAPIIPAAPAPASLARSEFASAPSASSATNLSRYYLRGW